MSRLKSFQSKVELDEHTFMWQTHLLTQAKEFKRKKEFLKTLLDVAGGPFCLSLKIEFFLFGY